MHSIIIITTLKNMKYKNYNKKLFCFLLLFFINIGYIIAFIDIFVFLCYYFFYY